MMAEKHEDEQNQLALAPPAPNGVGGFHCDLCNTEFTRRNDLTRHRESRKHQTAVNNAARPAVDRLPALERPAPFGIDEAIANFESNRNTHVVGNFQEGAALHLETTFYDRFIHKAKKTKTGKKQRQEVLSSLTPDQICNGWYGKELERILYTARKKAPNFKIAVDLYVNFVDNNDNHHERCFRSGFFEISRASNMIMERNRMMTRVLTGMHLDADGNPQNGSQLRYVSTTRAIVTFVEIQPINAGTYFPCPKEIQDKRAVVNVKNKDNRCFQYAVMASVMDVKKNAERPSKYEGAIEDQQFWFEDIPTPMPATRENFKRFEKNSGKKLCVVLCEMTDGKVDSISKLYSNKTINHDEQSIDLLLLEDGDKQHFCAIKDMSRLMNGYNSNHEHGSHVCRRCLLPFQTERWLIKHQKFTCQAGQVIEMPKDLEFKYRSVQKEQTVRYWGVYDVEAQMTTMPDGRQRHDPIAAGLLLMDQGTPIEYKVFHGRDCMKQMIERCREFAYVQDFPNVVDDKRFKEAKECYKCHTTVRKLVRDHDHLTGEYRGAACWDCNLQMQKPTFIPFYAHNAVHYDNHHLIRALKAFESLNVIAKDTQHYTIIKAKLIKKKGFLTMELRFQDSMNLMSTSLNNWVKSQSSLPISESLNGDGSHRELPFPHEYIAIDRFKETSLPPIEAFTVDEKECKPEDYVLARKAWTKYRCRTLYDYLMIFSKTDYMSQKLPFCYNYIRLDRLSETKLPTIEDFHDQLDDVACTPEKYAMARLVWDKFGCNTLGAFLDDYLRADVLQLADCVWSFRQASLNAYGLDPAWYPTTPGLSLDAMLKMNTYNIELMPCPDMYNFKQRGIRGGISQVCRKKYMKPNNPLVPGYNPSLPHTWGLYLDANNLYGKAMTMYLPTGGFKWEDNPPDWHDIGSEADRGYTYCVDLEYPEHLHDFFRDLPPCPIAMCPPGSKVPKLLSTLEKKEGYVIHYQLLKLVTDLGVKVTKVHNAISYNQAPWFKNYIDFNSSKRAKAADECLQDFFKLLNNALFGKSMEDTRKYEEFHLVTCKKQLNKLARKAKLKKMMIIDDDLSVVHMHQKKVLYNKPIFCGQAILDLSKMIMYDFHYNVMKKKYGDKIALCYMDTDSLIYEIETEDLYKDLESMKEHFDFSNYDKKHALYSTDNKKVPGKFKDENAGTPITEAIFLRSKVYDIQTLNPKKDKRKAKGVKKHTTAHCLSSNDYRDSLLLNKDISVLQRLFRAVKHQLHTIEQRRKALSNYDDKVICFNGIDCYPYGHKDLYPSTKRTLPQEPVYRD